MQLKSTIIDTFSRRGYNQSSLLTRRQFHILMNTLLSQATTHSHWLFDQNLANQIWRQAEQRVGKQQQQIRTEIVISTMVDAIQILTNRMVECQERIDELKQKRQQCEFEQNFIQLQPLQKKIDTLKRDSEQFQKDFKLLTEPFMSGQAKLQLKRQSVKRKVTNNQSQQQHQNQQKSETHNNAIDKGRLFQQIMNIHNSLQKKQQFQQLVTQPLQPPLIKRTADYKQEKNCAFYLLVFLAVLQVTVCMVKYDFPNLIVYLICFVALGDTSFFPNLLKLSSYSLILSLAIDAIWLLTYMHSYLHMFLHSSVKKQLKPYYQYIWFVTLLQQVLKLLLLYFVKSYEVNFVIEERERRIKEEREELDVVVKNAQIPKVKELIMEDLAKNKTKEVKG